VAFAGRLAPELLRERLQRARAFLFAAVEDFGIAPVEAMACGTPVIALRRGGAAETVAGLDTAELDGRVLRGADCASGGRCSPQLRAKRRPHTRRRLPPPCGRLRRAALSLRIHGVCHATPCGLAASLAGRRPGPA